MLMILFCLQMIEVMVAHIVALCVVVDWYLHRHYDQHLVSMYNMHNVFMFEIYKIIECKDSFMSFQYKHNKDIL